MAQGGSSTVRWGGTPSGRGEVMDAPTNLRRRAKLPDGSAGGAPPAGADPPPCLRQGQHPDRTSSPVRMLPSFNIGGRPSPGQGRKIPISPTFVCTFSELVGIYWLDCTCT